MQIYDTTLRDGAQRTDISLSLNDKLNIARRLDELGVSFIEGGWPGSNPKDAEFFKTAAAMHWHNARITAFGATCAANKTPAEDANIRALLEAQTSHCTVVGKSSVLQVLLLLRHRAMPPSDQSGRSDIGIATQTAFYHVRIPPPSR